MNKITTFRTSGFGRLPLPRANGFELVEWMRTTHHCKFIPVIILSSSALAADVNRAYAFGANAYMVKPADAESLRRLFQTIADFWVATARPEELLPSAA